MKIIIEDHDGFHKSDPTTRMDMLLMALKRAGYQLRGKPMPSWGCEPTTLLSPYQCGNNWIPIIVGYAQPGVASTQEGLLTQAQRADIIKACNAVPDVVKLSVELQQAPEVTGKG